MISSNHVRARKNIGSGGEGGDGGGGYVAHGYHRSEKKRSLLAGR